MKSNNWSPPGYVPTLTASTQIHTSLLRSAHRITTILGLLSLLPFLPPAASLNFLHKLLQLQTSESLSPFRCPPSPPYASLSLSRCVLTSLALWHSNSEFHSPETSDQTVAVAQCAVRKAVNKRNGTKRTEMCVCHVCVWLPHTQKETTWEIPYHLPVCILCITILAC